MGVMGPPTRHERSFMVIIPCKNFVIISFVAYSTVEVITVGDTTADRLALTETNFARMIVVISIVTLTYLRLQCRMGQATYVLS